MDRESEESEVIRRDIALAESSTPGDAPRVRTSPALIHTPGQILASLQVVAEKGNGKMRHTGNPLRLVHHIVVWTDKEINDLSDVPRCSKISAFSG